MRHYKIYILFFMVFFSTKSFASQFISESLENSVSKNTIIFTAQVLKTSQTNSPQEITYTIDIKSVTSLQPVQSPKDKLIKQLIYRQIVPYVYDKKGKVVGWFSPIVNASGIESSLNPGENYLFFSDQKPNEQGVLEIFRAEPLEKKEKVIELIKKLPQTSAPDSSKPDSKNQPTK